MARKQDKRAAQSLPMLIGGGLVLLALAAVLLMLSGRLSYEMVLKAARARIPLVCSVSAPTALGSR